MLGVNGSSSSGSVEILVRGLSLRMISNMHKLVCKNSSCNVWLWRRGCKTFSADWTSRSHTPPQCGERAAMNFHFIPLCDIWRWMFAWSILLSTSLRIFSAPTKFYPLSLITSVGLARLASNLEKHEKKESFDKSYGMSNETARLQKIVKMHPYRLNSFIAI